jgi:hypothetical protein
MREKKPWKGDDATAGSSVCHIVFHEMNMDCPEWRTISAPSQSFAQKQCLRLVTRLASSWSLRGYVINLRIAGQMVHVFPKMKSGGKCEPKSIEMPPVKQFQQDLGLAGS